jgi:hypothetical protein
MNDMPYRIYSMPVGKARDGEIFGRIVLVHVQDYETLHATEPFNVKVVWK